MNATDGDRLEDTGKSVTFILDTGANISFIRDK